MLVFVSAMVSWQLCKRNLCCIQEVNHALSFCILYYAFVLLSIVTLIHLQFAVTTIQDLYSALEVHHRIQRCCNVYVENIITAVIQAAVMLLGTQTHTRLTALFPGLPRWAGTRKVKPIWILLKRETVSSSGISWAICKSASRSRHITMPVPHHSFFTGRILGNYPVCYVMHICHCLNQVFWYFLCRVVA